MSEAVETLRADFHSHHVEGYAVAALERGQDGKFSAPLVSHIEGNLYVGGCIGGVSLGDEFKTVVSLYPWEKYLISDDTVRIEVRMFDADTEPDQAVVDETAAFVVGALERGKTLVHCQAGLNRSNLIAASALVMLGRTPEAAIALLRERRSPLVLCNATFETWLLGRTLPEPTS